MTWVKALEDALELVLGDPGPQSATTPPVGRHHRTLSGAVPAADQG